MSITQSSKWLTVCLYYSEPWEEFLLKAVKPYVDVVMTTGIADYFYFQRSWKRGPHIRLWFKGNADIIETMLKPNLEEHFSQYFESKPSFRKEPTYPDDFPANKKWFPNNSIQYVENLLRDYDFGGSVVYFIAQKQFNASSNLVLETLKNKGGRWTYDDSISAAFKMHLSFAYGIGMDLQEMQAFFQRMSESWQPDSQAINLASTSQTTSTHLPSFQKAFDLQKTDLTAFAAALWESLENDRNIRHEPYENWILRNLNVNVELGLIQDAGKLNRKVGGYPMKSDGLSEDKIALWLLYAEFIHCTNNRLGIRGKDEGYLYFILDNCLQLVLLKKQQEPRRFVIVERA